jgi:hypothetical protein
MQVKTTNPKRYLVKPNQGLIRAGEDASVNIILQQQDSEAMIALNKSGEKVEADKFLVQIITPDGEFWDAVSAKPTKVAF